MMERTRVTILVGTMSGTAEMVADELASALRDDGGFEPVILRMERASLASLDAAGVLLVCTSTYGHGDPPDNAKALYAALSEQRPDLSGKRYAVFGLGDRQHAATFGFGGKKFDELFAELGAARLVERGLHDVRSGIYPEEQALEWLTGFIAAARAA